MLGLILSLLRGLAKGVWRRLTRGPTLPTWSFALDVAVPVQREALGYLATLEGAALRKSSSSGLPPSKPVQALRFEVVEAPVRGRWIRPTAGDGRGSVLFLHGGGYVVGSVDSHLDFAGRLVIAGGFDVFSLDYRLAPEHPHPAAVDDAVAAWRWLREQGIGPSRIAVAGDSAGGGLTAALLLRLRELGEALPAGAGLVSPWVELTGSSASVRINTPTDYLTPALLEKWSRDYAGGRDRSEPLISPLNAELHGLPPLLVQVGGAEILRDEGLAFARKAEAAGVDVTLALWEEMPHDWHLLAGLEARGRGAIDELAHFLRARLDGRARQDAAPRPTASLRASGAVPTTPRGSGPGAG